MIFASSMKRPLAILLLFVLLLVSLPFNVSVAATPFRLLASIENQDMEGLLQAYAKEAQISLHVTYQSTMQLMATLNQANCPYDGVWLSNSIWLYMLNGKQKITDSKVTAINPIVFGITKSKAQALGFTDHTPSMQDIVEAVKTSRLRFIMPSATQTNSGASAYLGFISTLAGNKEVLTMKALQGGDLSQKLKELFSGVARNSGSEDYMEQLYLSGEYDAMVNYEFMIIGLNKRLEAQGKEPLYLVYPQEGVSLSDSPFAYIDQGDKEKKAAFLKLQGHLLSAPAQKAMAETGRRTGFGGLNPYGDESVFNPQWGIDINAYLTPIKYPAADVIREAFRLYQEEFKKPAVTVFCLDMSGSMYNQGYNELINAMTKLLTPQTAAEAFIQFGKKDRIVLIPFDSKPRTLIEGTGEEQAALLKSLKNHEASGGTDIYEALIRAYNTLSWYDDTQYTLAVVLMTDGESQGGIDEFKRIYEKTAQDIGVYSITFGSANARQLNALAQLTGGKVFDGKTDLLTAFQTVRGYN